MFEYGNESVFPNFRIALHIAYRDIDDGGVCCKLRAIFQLTETDPFIPPIINQWGEIVWFTVALMSIERDKTENTVSDERIDECASKKVRKVFYWLAPCVL